MKSFVLIWRYYKKHVFCIIERHIPSASLGAKNRWKIYFKNIKRGYWFFLDTWAVSHMKQKKTNPNWLNLQVHNMFIVLFDKQVGMNCKKFYQVKKHMHISFQ